MANNTTTNGLRSEGENFPNMLDEVDSLMDSGIEEEHAKAIVKVHYRIINSHLATKRDLEDVRSALVRDIEDVRSALVRDIEGVRSALVRDIEDVRSALARDIEDVRSELKGDIEGVRSALARDIEKMGYKLTIRMGILYGGSIGVLLTLILTLAKIGLLSIE